MEHYNILTLNYNEDAQGQALRRKVCLVAAGCLSWHWLDA